MTVESLVHAHEDPFKAVEAKKGGQASDADLADLRAMLSAQGVAQVSDSISKYSQELAGQKHAGLWSLVASFRAQMQKTKAPRVKPRKGSNHIPQTKALCDHIRINHSLCITKLMLKLRYDCKASNALSVKTNVSGNQYLCVFKHRGRVLSIDFSLNNNMNVLISVDVVKPLNN